MVVTQRSQVIVVANPACALSGYFGSDLVAVAGTGSALRFRTTMASPCSAIPMFRTMGGFGACAGAGVFVSALAVPAETRTAITRSFVMGVLIDLMRPRRIAVPAYAATTPARRTFVICHFEVSK